MSKLKIILLSILILGLSICVGFSAYLIVSTNLDVSFDNMVTTKHKVTFTDNGNIVKTMYVDNNYNLSLKDAPYYFNSNNAPIKWVEDDGTVLNDFNGIIDSSLNFIASDFINDELDSNSYNETSTLNFNDTNRSVYVLTGSLTMRYDGSNTHSENWGKMVNGDTTIGTANNTCYKQIKLQRDIIVTGNISIGAYTGYYGSNNEYSQISYQGFIIGNYCSLDLNGHDLILGNPSASNFNNYAMIDCWGELTDTSEDSTGTLILTDTAKMYQSFVIEDIYHEKRMPYTYYTNDNVFTMYRCPYWTCNTKILSGAIVMGKYNIDLGANNGNSSHGDIILIGNSGTNTLPGIDLNDGGSADSFIQLDSGYIYRYISENNELANNSTINNDILDQKINYEVYDASVTLHKFYMGFSYENINKDLDSSSYDFFISPYYSFYLFNTTLNLNQHLVFMPGSYLFVDEYSIINMSYNQYQRQDGFGGGAIPTVNTKYWQSVAGLTFLDYLYDMDDLLVVLKYDNDTYDNDSNLSTDNTEGYSCKIYQNDNIRTHFWNSLSRASADIYGETEFIKQTYKQYSSIEFGGEINIYDIDTFISNYTNSSSNLLISLYSSTFKSDWCRIIGGSGISDALLMSKKYRNVTGYYNYPLISNGYCLYNPSTGNINTSGTLYKYDFTSKIIYNQSNISETYIWKFNDDRMDNLSKCANIENNDSLAGSFVRVNASYDSSGSYTGQISYNSVTYIVWHGAYIQNTNNGYYVGKFFDNDIYGNANVRDAWWQVLHVSSSKYNLLNCSFNYDSPGKYTLISYNAIKL